VQNFGSFRGDKSHSLRRYERITRGHWDTPAPARLPAQPHTGNPGEERIGRRCYNSQVLGDEELGDEPGTASRYQSLRQGG